MELHFNCTLTYVKIGRSEVQQSTWISILFVFHSCFPLSSGEFFSFYFYFFQRFHSFCCIYSTSVHHMHAWRLCGTEEGIRSSGTTPRDGCEPPHGCWEPHSGPLQEQQVLLPAEPSLHPWRTLLTFSDLSFLP